MEHLCCNTGYCAYGRAIMTPVDRYFAPPGDFEVLFCSFAQGSSSPECCSNGDVDP